MVWSIDYQKHALVSDTIAAFKRTPPHIATQAMLLESGTRVDDMHNHQDQTIGFT